MSKNFKNEIILKDKELNIKTKYGSNLNDKMPSVFYLRTKIKITPIKEKLTYENDLNQFKKSFTQEVNNIIKECNFINRNYLFDIDMSLKAIKYDKFSFLRYNLYLKPKSKDTLLNHKSYFEYINEKINKKLISLLENNGIKYV